jgi:hypothetical protein
VLTDFLHVDGDPVPMADYLHAITHTHQRRVRVRILDLNHKRVGWVGDVMDGQVTIDVTQRDVSRVANLRFLDPAQALGWEPDSPSSLPLHMRRMVQVLDDRAVPGYGWVSCPVFTGPVDEFDRDGAEVTLTAGGKERLALGSFGRSHSWAKGRMIVDVIQEIMTLAGESPTRIHLPAIGARLPKEFNVSRTDKPLVKARKLARSVDCFVFYDGRGHFRMRRRPTHPTLTLDENWLRGPVRLDRPKLEFHNRWIIFGPKPGGNKPRPFADVWLPKPNAYSAWSIGRDVAGERVPRWLVYEDERNAKTHAKLLEIANRKRDEKIRFSADVSLDALPFPAVEEWDLYRAKDPATGTVITQVRQATIPLVAGDMTIGALKRVSRVKRHGGFHFQSHPLHGGGHHFQAHGGH